MDQIVSFMEAVCDALSKVELREPLVAVDEDETSERELYEKIIAACSAKSLITRRPEVIPSGGFFCKRRLQGDLMFQVRPSGKVYVEIKILRANNGGGVTSAAVSDIRNAVLQTVEYSNCYKSDCAILLIIDEAKKCSLEHDDREMLKTCETLLSGDMGLTVGHIYKNSGEWTWEFMRF